MRVLVTGASGFVGQHLRERAEAEGAEFVGRDREVDVADPDAMRELIAGVAPDAVVHLAALSFVPDSEARPTLAFRVNYGGSLNVLEACHREAPEARVLMVTTGQVYGAGVPGSPPFTEEDALRPVSAYARAKAAVDLLAGVYAERGLDVARLRPFNHTGPGRPDQFAESSFARQIVRMERDLEPPRLEVGNLDAVRDFLHVDDVVDAYWRMLQPGAPRGAFNVASERAVSMREVLDVLLAHSSATPEVCEVAERWRPADASVGSAARLAEAVGWAPRKSLEETLADLLEDWREREG